MMDARAAARVLGVAVDTDPGAGWGGAGGSNENLPRPLAGHAAEVIKRAYRKQILPCFPHRDVAAAPEREHFHRLTAALRTLLPAAATADAATDTELFDRCGARGGWRWGGRGGRGGFCIFFTPAAANSRWRRPSPG